jgi:hypothetical protein
LSKTYLRHPKGKKKKKFLTHTVKQIFGV